LYLGDQPICRGSELGVSGLHHLNLPAPPWCCGPGQLPLAVDGLQLAAAYAAQLSLLSDQECAAEALSHLQVRVPGTVGVATAVAWQGSQCQSLGATARSQLRQVVWVGSVGP
jgi:hypothetical protein